MIRFGRFYNISTIVGYSKPNSFNTNILNMYDFFGWVSWHITHCRLFNAKSILIHIHSSIQTIQFNTSGHFSFIRAMHGTLSGATTLGQIEIGSNGNEGVLRFPKAPTLQEPHHQIV